MSEAKMRVDAMAGLAAPPFHPIRNSAEADRLYDARAYTNLLYMILYIGGGHTAGLAVRAFVCLQ